MSCACATTLTRSPAFSILNLNGLCQQQEGSMSDQHSGKAQPCAPARTSRRTFLKSSTGLVAGAAAAEVMPRPAAAQNADAELARLQGARRILIKGGIVLSVDRQVGDFAQADVLIEDGKIRELRPNIAASDSTIAVVDAANRVIIPGFV